MKPSDQCRSIFFNPNGRVSLLRFIWGVFWAYPASFQGQVGGFVWQFTILLGVYFGPILRHFRFRVKLGVLFGNLRFCWAYIGPLRAYVRPYNILGQLEGFISGSSWGFCLAIYDFVGLILGHFGPMLGPATYWVIWKAICWAYLGPSGHIGSFQGWRKALETLRRFSAVAMGGWGGARWFADFWGSKSVLEMCKKHCKLQEKLLLAHVCGDAFA